MRYAVATAGSALAVAMGLTSAAFAQSGLNSKTVDLVGAGQRAAPVLFARPWTQRLMFDRVTRPGLLSLQIVSRGDFDNRGAVLANLRLGSTTIHKRANGTLGSPRNASTAFAFRIYTIAGDGPETAVLRVTGQPVTGQGKLMLRDLVIDLRAQGQNLARVAPDNNGPLQPGAAASRWIVDPAGDGTVPALLLLTESGRARLSGKFVRYEIVQQGRATKVRRTRYALAGQRVTVQGIPSTASEALAAGLTASAEGCPSAQVATLRQTWGLRFTLCAAVVAAVPQKPKPEPVAPPRAPAPKSKPLPPALKPIEADYSKRLKQRFPSVSAKPTAKIVFDNKVPACIQAALNDANALLSKDPDGLTAMAKLTQSLEACKSRIEGQIRAAADQVKLAQEVYRSSQSQRDTVQADVTRFGQDLDGKVRTQNEAIKAQIRAVEAREKKLAGQRERISRQSRRFLSLARRWSRGFAADLQSRNLCSTFSASTDNGRPKIEGQVISAAAKAKTEADLKANALFQAVEGTFRITTSPPEGGRCVVDVCTGAGPAVSSTVQIEGARIRMTTMRLNAMRTASQKSALPSQNDCPSVGRCLDRMAKNGARLPIRNFWVQDGDAIAACVRRRGQWRVRRRVAATDAALVLQRK
ncbi:MAG: hypothetical protein AAFR04_14365 [Pseudomonadota bacterium]